MLNFFFRALEQEECVPIRNLHSWLQTKISEKYRPGLRRIFDSVRPVLEVLVSIERNLLTLGGLICSNIMDGENDQKERSSDKCFSFNKIQSCKAAVDRMIQSMELVREFPNCADYNSFSRMVRICRELAEIFSNGVKVLRSNEIGESHPLCREALERICKTLPTFSSELSTLENSIEETRLVTEQLGAIKERIMGKLVTDVESDRDLVLEARQAQSELMTARARYDSAKQRAELICADPRLNDGRKLEAERDELAVGMDAVLSPFVRISHNIQGKGGALVIGGELTPEEAACVRKYTGVLTRADMYELLEEEGSIENLLEALFLLGIAGGVGAEPTISQPALSTVHALAPAINAPVSARPPPPAGLSRKSQALLTDALNKFQADKFRSSHAEWRDRRHRLASLESCVDYQARRAAAAAAASDLLDEARALDLAVRRAQEAEERGRRAGASLRDFQDHVAARLERGSCYAIATFPKQPQGRGFSSVLLMLFSLNALIPLTAHACSAFQELGIRLRVIVSIDSEDSAETLA
jgi:hypothetical protein